MNRTLSVGAACFCGAALGAFVGLDLLDSLMPAGLAGILGMAIGGIVGYLIVDFRELCAGVKRAWIRTMAWRPDWYLVPAWLSALPAAIMFTVSGVLGMNLFAATLDGITGSRILYFWKPGAFNDPMLHYALPLVFFGISLLGVFGSANEVREQYKDGRSFLAYYSVQALKWACILSPVGALLIAVVFIVIGIPAFFGLLWASLAAIGRFVARCFVEVHSSRRTICFVDAAIGAGAGFYFGSALIGGIIGAVLGMANYELVSIRWLKLAPR